MKKKLWTYTRNAILTGMLIYGLFYVSFNIVSPNLTVQYLGWKPYVVLTSSMEPTIKKGSLVIATWKDPNLLEKDDIVVVTPHKRFGIVHYLADKEFDDGNLFLRTRKYSAKEPSEWDYWRVPEDEYVGCVKSIHPLIGNVILFLKSICGIVTIAVVVVASCAFKKFIKRTDKN